MTTTRTLPNDLIDQLLSGYKKPEDLIGENGLLKQLTKALIERALQAEMTDTWVMTNMLLSATSLAMPATAKAARPSRVNLVSCRLKSLVIARVALNHN